VDFAGTTYRVVTQGATLGLLNQGTSVITTLGNATSLGLTGSTFFVDFAPNRTAADNFTFLVFGTNGAGREFSYSSGTLAATGKDGPVSIGSSELVGISFRPELGNKFVYGYTDSIDSVVLTGTLIGLTAVPEPAATAAVFGGAALALAAWVRRRRW
jgi:hypothetical protein